MQAKIFYIVTLGCKVNQYESEAVREAWLKAGHIESNTAANADLVLINSCAITSKAVSGLRNMIRKIRRQSPTCELLICGCAAEALPAELQNLEINSLIGQRDKIKLLTWPSEQTDFSAQFKDLPASASLEKNNQALPKALSEARANTLSDAGPVEVDFWNDPGPREELSENLAKEFLPFKISNYARSRAVLKIHDGCSQHCSYCIVPQGRGASVSRPWAEVLAEAGRLIDAGFREIVLNGINLRQYGKDLHPKLDFWDLLKRLESTFAAEWAGPRQAEDPLRFRLSSLEPGQLNDKALEVLSSSSLIAPQLHLSLQSGSSKTLKAMGRGHYNPLTIPDFLAKLKSIWSVFGLGADFITGFPGESAEDFSESVALVKALPFSYAHIFPYSERPGTLAASLKGKLSSQIRKERAAILRALVAEKNKSFLEEQLNLPFMWLVAENNKEDSQSPVNLKALGLKAVNEYYVDCLFKDETALPEKKLIKARAVGLEDKLLLVEKI